MQGDVPQHVSAAFHQYQWADTPERVIVCCARDVLRLRKPFPSLDVPLFLHGRWPCVYVEIVGLVVGGSREDKRMHYMLDDGTAVVDIFVSHKRHAHVRSEPHLPPEERGVYSCYVPSAQVQRRAVPESFEVGELARAVGRVCAYREQNAISALSLGKTSARPTPDARFTRRRNGRAAPHDASTTTREGDLCICPTTTGRMRDMRAPPS